MLGFGTSWRQGHILRTEDAISLGLIKPGQDKLKAVVVTHDCDLQSPSDKFVELIIGEVKKVQRQFKRAKHPRILHLCFDETSAIEMRHDKKVVMPKADFHCESFDADMVITDDEKQGLKQWLAAKYGRPAFPNSFEDRLRAYDEGKFAFEGEVAKIIEKYADELVGIFFDLGDARFEDLPEGEPYELSISVVYDGIEGGAATREAAAAAARELKTIFERYYGTADLAQMIALEDCIPVADTNFTLYSLRKMDQWRVEYISLSAEHAGEYLASGTY